MAKPKYGNKENVKGGVLKRARRRAKKQGREGLLKGGVTGAEARSLAKRSPGYKRNRGNVKGGVKARALDRVDYLRDHGGVPGGVRTKDGITRREARKVRGAYMKERRFDPLRPRGGRDILGEAEALTNQEFLPQEQELGRARRSEQGRANVLYGQGGFFDKYQADVAAAAQRQQVADQAFQAGQNAAVQNAYNQWAQQQAQLDQKSATKAAQGGTQADPMLAQMAAQAAAGRQQSGQNAAALMGQQGSANAAFMNAQSVAATQQRGEGMLESQARLRKVDDLARELSAQRGATKSANVSKLKDTERQYSLERSAFGLDVAKERNDAKQSAADRRQKRREARRDQRNKNREFNQRQADIDHDNSVADRREDRYDRADRADDGKLNGSSGASGKSGKYTRSQKNSNQEKYRSTKSSKSLYNSSKKFRKLPTAKKVAFVAHKENVDPLIARAAVAPGTLTAGQRRELRRMGIKIGAPLSNKKARGYGEGAKDKAGSFF